MEGSALILAILEFIVIIAVMARIDSIHKMTQENNQILRQINQYLIDRDNARIRQYQEQQMQNNNPYNQQFYRH